jgi:hypothetical protein
MPFFSQKKLPSNPPPANGLALASQSTQQSRPVCTWSTHAPQCGPSPLPFPRSSHTLTATATVAGELFLFGGLIGHARLCASSDLYVFSTQDFSTTLLQTSGEVPTPRFAHGAALISTATLLICGGRLNFDDQNGLNHDTLYLLNLGTSSVLNSSSTPADHNFALQYRESGPALWSMVPDQAVVIIQPQSWSVPSSSSSVVRLAGRTSMIRRYSISLSVLGLTGRTSVIYGAWI